MNGKRLRDLRISEGITQEALGEIINLSKKTVSAYENNLADPSTDTLYKIADHFGVSSDYLKSVTPEELRTQIIKIENRHTRSNDIIQTKEVPVLGVIRAGKPIYADEHIEEWVPIDACTAASGEYFYLRVIGDSMSPTIPEGSLVLIRRQDDVLAGQIAVVIVNEDNATLKRVYCDERNCILQSDNKSYPPMSFPKEDVIILGRAVKLTQDLL